MLRRLVRIERLPSPSRAPFGFWSRSFNRFTGRFQRTYDWPAQRPDEKEKRLFNFFENA